MVFLNLILLRYEKNMPRFYWECLNQHPKFTPDKNYLVYYKGCYAPPTAGHFDTAERFFNMAPNIHVMIHQTGSESRHGVPKYLNREIWETYISELLSYDRIHLIQHDSQRDIIDLIDSSDTYFDEVIYIRGNEDYDIAKMERSTKKSYRKTIKRLKERNIPMSFYILDRPRAHILSASKFVESLIKTKRYSDNKKYKYNKFYLPPNLDKYIAIDIINKLQQHWLF